MGKQRDDEFELTPGNGGGGGQGRSQGGFNFRIPRSASSGAIYHLTVKTGSRGKGQSAVAKINYVARVGKYTDRDPKSDRDQVLHVESQNMPAWAERGEDPRARAYWAAADKHERANGRLFREVEFALPRALDEPQNLALAREFASQVARVEGGQLPYTLAIHEGRGRNPHVHLVLSERVNDGIERGKADWFKRAANRGQDPAAGGARKARELIKKDWLQTTREQWEQTANKHLALAGRPERIDHRTLEAQGIDREPQKKRESVAEQIEKRGGKSRVRWAQSGALQQPAAVAEFRLAGALAMKAGNETAVGKLQSQVELRHQLERSRLKSEQEKGCGMER